MGKHPKWIGSEELREGQWRKSRACRLAMRGVFEAPPKIKEQGVHKRLKLFYVCWTFL